MENDERNVRCDSCGCAFVPELLTEKDGEMEYTFFRCDYCGKAYMVSVTDEKLRESIAGYVQMAEENKTERLPEAEQRKMQQLKTDNAAYGRELLKLTSGEAHHEGK